MNIVPQKLKDGDNAALTTPLTVTGTAEELDRDLPATVVNFVAAHLELKNTLDRAKAEMDAAAKAAQAEARSKSKMQLQGSRRSPNRQKLPRAPNLFRRHLLESPRAAGLFDSA